MLWLLVGLTNAEKATDISKHASYEVIGEDEESQEAYDAGYADGFNASSEGDTLSTSNQDASTTIPVGGVGGSRETDVLYAGG